MENSDIGVCVYCGNPLATKREIVGGIECTPRYVCRPCLNKLTVSKTAGEYVLALDGKLFPKTKESN